MIKRELYLQKIRPFYDSDEIKVLIGIRRCGKSTLLKQIADELSSQGGNIIFYDFEDYDDASYCSNPQEFYKAVKSRLSDGRKNYVFLDEVHYLDDYLRVVASIRSSLHCSVFITDSSASLVSGELATRFTGRSKEFLIMPFSFREVAQITGACDMAAFERYLVKGGMPATYDGNCDEGYVNRLYVSILERDIASRFPIRNKDEFKKVASFLLLNSGETFSARSIADYLKTQLSTCSVPTVMNYASYIRDAFLVNECRRYSIKGKQVLQSLSKHYAADTAFVAIQEKTGNHHLGHLLETVVFNELLSRGYEVFIGRTYNGEIDFIAKNGNERAYYQVAYSLVDSQVQEREFSAFKQIDDSYPRYVISTDTFDFSRNGINHVNILDFLLRKE